MRVIEHRRHTMRTMPGQHLSQQGVELARRVGNDLGKFDLVVTSTLPRAFETALAMGYAVDEQLEQLSELPPGVDQEVPMDASFETFSQLLRETPDGPAARFAETMASLHVEIAERLPDGGRALVISHGWFVEASAAACLPDEDFAKWGPGCDYCEGFRLFQEDGRFVRGELLRVSSGAHPG